MPKTITKTNLKKFMHDVEKFTGYHVSDRAFDLAWKEFNKPEEEPKTDGE